MGEVSQRKENIAVGYGRMLYCMVCFLVRQGQTQTASGIVQYCITLGMETFVP